MPDESTTTPTFRAEVSAVDDDVPAVVKGAVLAATGFDPWLAIAAVVTAMLVGAIALDARRRGGRK